MQIYSSVHKNKLTGLPVEINDWTFKTPVSSSSKPLYVSLINIQTQHKYTHTAVYAGAACQRRRVKF